MKKEPQFVYFGGEPLGAPVLETLLEAGLKPALVVCNPNRPVGRKQVMTPPPVKVFAEQHDIEVVQPKSIPQNLSSSTPLPRVTLGRGVELVDDEKISRLIENSWDLFVVVAYNHILPKWLIELPKHGTLNVHPSLLPKFRGPSPIRTAILTNARLTGVSVMLLDEKMDHGPILAQEVHECTDEEWPCRGSDLDRRLASLGGQLLATTIPRYLAGEITSHEQDHDAATYTKKFTRADGELELDPYSLPTDETAYKILLKIRAFDGFPGTFFIHNDKRIKINEAELTRTDAGSWGQLRLVSVTPESRSTMEFSDFLDTI